MFLFLAADVPDPLFCPNNCGRRYRGFKRKWSLMRHINNECGLPKQFQCHICLKLFAHKYVLKKHCLCIHKLLLN